MGNYTDQSNFRRVSATLGTPHVAGDYALSAGFGATGSVAVTAGSNDQRFRITITAAGAGVAANPTCTLTFKEPFATAPFAVINRSGGSQNTLPWIVTTTTTALVITLVGTPDAAETFAFTGVLLG